MVGFRNYGRRGNFLYMTAAMIGYSIKHGLEYSVPNITNNPEWNVIGFEHLINPNWEQGREDVLINENWTAEQHYQELPFEEEWRDKQIVLNGYFQSFRYIAPYRDEIIKAFDYPYEMNNGVCAIHVRHGDYLLYPLKHPVVTDEYLIEAIWKMIDDVGCTNFLFHSDDINWCKNFIERVGNKNINFEFSENKTPEQDLVSMANCEHNICSNSTLALWGAELNQNPDKVVIVPHEDNWFGVDNKNLSVKDLFRPEWVRIKYTPIYDL